MVNCISSPASGSIYSTAMDQLPWMFHKHLKLTTPKSDFFFPLVTAHTVFLFCLNDSPRHTDYLKVLVAQSCPTLCNLSDCSPPASSGILQATMLEWVATPFSRGSCRPRDWTRVSCIAGIFFTIWATRLLELVKTLILKVRNMAPDCVFQTGFSNVLMLVIKTILSVTRL